jgi:hypothetical protein
MNLMPYSRLPLLASLFVLLTACAPVPPQGAYVSTQYPATNVPPDSLAAGVSTQSYAATYPGDVRTYPADRTYPAAYPMERPYPMTNTYPAPGAVPSDYRLSILQICDPSGVGCKLAFVDSLPGEDVTQLTRAYFQRATNAMIPQVSVERNCAPGWVSKVLSEQGSVQGGGLLHAQAAVCGYPEAMSAIVQALSVCDAKTSGGCRTSSRISVVWGYWDGNVLPGRNMDPGRPNDVWNYPGGQSCESTVPVVESGTCSRAAAQALRAAGVRLP